MRTLIPNKGRSGDWTTKSLASSEVSNKPLSVVTTNKVDVEELIRPSLHLFANVLNSGVLTSPRRAQKSRLATLLSPCGRDVSQSTAVLAQLLCAIVVFHSTVVIFMYIHDQGSRRGRVDDGVEGGV